MCVREIEREMNKEVDSLKMFHRFVWYINNTIVLGGYFETISFEGVVKIWL